MDESTTGTTTKTLLPLQPNSSFVITGPTNSGKSIFTKKLINELNNMYESNPPTKVLYCYRVHQVLFDEMERSMKNILFHEGLPTERFIEEYSDTEHTLIVLDDLMNVVLNSEMVERLFVQSCHHKGLSVVFITQNIYQPGSRARTINLNATYLCLFHNIRDKLQVNCLAKQMYPGQTKMFMEAYDDCIKNKYGYLFIDMYPHSQDEYRLRTNIFPGEDTIIYRPNE